MGLALFIQELFVFNSGLRTIIRMFCRCLDYAMMSNFRRRAAGVVLPMLSVVSVVPVLAHRHRTDRTSGGSLQSCSHDPSQ